MGNAYLFLMDVKRRFGFTENKCKKMLAQMKMWCYYKRTKHREME